MTDVAVIGAGPAGCVAAYALAKKGRDVTLIEKHRFPRDKVCGESLSALGIAVLRRMGLEKRIGALGPAILTRVGLWAGDGRGMSCPLPSAMWGVSRLAMDAELLAAVREAGARVLQPARCESI